MALLSVLVLVAVGTTAWVLTDRLVSETTDVAESTGEVLIATQQVSASFAEADAAAVSVHLAGADGNREQRRLYEQATDRATSSLERVARLVGDDEPSHAALSQVAARTNQYVGLIEAARFASIENIAGANDTLTEASEINRDDILPDVRVVSDRARARFDDQISSAWYSIAIVLLVVALVVLLVVQVILNRQFRRVINVPLALATIVVLILVFVSSRGFAAQQTAFNDAETEAFDAIVVSEQVQQTAYRHRALTTEWVLNDSQLEDQIAELEALVMRDGGGLLIDARTEAGSIRERAGADEVIARWERYLVEVQRIRGALGEDDAALAEDITQGSANAAFNGFNTSVEAALLDNREQFLSQLQRASDALVGLRAMILIGSLLAAVLTWWGFALRIGEYR